MQTDIPGPTPIYAKTVNVYYAAPPDADANAPPVADANAPPIADVNSPAAPPAVSAEPVVLPVKPAASMATNTELTSTTHPATATAPTGTALTVVDVKPKERQPKPVELKKRRPAVLHVRQQRCGNEEMIWWVLGIGCCILCCPCCAVFFVIMLVSIADSRKR